MADYEVKVAVRRYDEALAQAYARASVAPLGSTATADEQQRIGDIIGFLAQGGFVMDARQESFEPSRVTHRDATHAELESTEHWWYRHWNPKSGEVKQAPRRVRYVSRYQLLKVAGRWQVDRVLELEYEQLALGGGS